MGGLLLEDRLVEPTNLRKRWFMETDIERPSVRAAQRLVRSSQLLRPAGCKTNHR
jgi:hypothetical protein